MRTLILLFMITWQAWGEVSLDITGGNVRRPKLVVGKFHMLNPIASADNETIARMENALKANLEWMNLFDFLPTASISDLDASSEISGLNYDAWAPRGASFVLRLGQKQEAGKIIVEAHLFDIPSRKRLFGSRFQYAASQAVRVITALSEEILKQVAGERGLFESRIAMVCRNKKGETSPKEVFVMDADGKNVVQLTTDKTISLSPAWTPDRSALIYTQYASYSGTRKKGIVMKKHSLITGQRTILSQRDGVNSGAAVSPDGEKLALTLSFNGRPEIYLMPPLPGQEPEPFSRKVRIKRLGGEGFQTSYDSLLFDVEPSFSPDGKQMVFSSARSGNPMIYTAEIASKIGNQLTFAGKYNATPAWSPKGDKILFAAQRAKEGNFDIYIIDPDGNNLNRLTVGDRNGGRRVNSEKPSWAPTGRHFAFAANDGGSYAVYAITTDATHLRKLSPDNKECFEPAWGPPEN